jgi:hypothetical protein
MANEREPKAKQSATGVARSQRPKSGGNPEFSTDRKPVSTSEPTVITSRNAVIQGNAVISSDDVRQRAYELYEQRGRLEGFHEQDWFEAETQLRSGQNGSKQDGRRKSA